MGELVDLDQVRREVWARNLREMRAVGHVAVFRSVIEQEAVVIPFPVSDLPPDGAA